MNNRETNNFTNVMLRCNKIHSIRISVNQNIL
jgi:hypothetical protein